MNILPDLHHFVAFSLRLFFLLTPFFVLSTFLTVTGGAEPAEKRRLAINVCLGAMSVSLLIFLFGSLIMLVFGITVSAFRAGSGVLLLLSAITLVNGGYSRRQEYGDNLHEIALVPLAVPVTAGPAVLGALMVEGMDMEGWRLKMVTVLAIMAANAAVGVMLYVADRIADLLGRSRIMILSKITGLVLSAIAMQMIVAGVRELWQ